MKQLFLCFFLFGWLFSAAQSFKVEGVVAGNEGEALQSATAVLLSPKDSTLVAFGMTDKNGYFKLTGVKQNEYLLQISYLGYDQYVDTLNLIEQVSDLDLGNIRMELNTNQLSEVVIEGEHTPILVKKDTLEYNANAFKTQPNEVVEDLLRKMPGVEVESDGTIIAQGEEVQKVVVDGKEFFGDDPQLATKNLPAKSVDKVQFYDKKSDRTEFSGVDDGVREKTMNLELKEDYKKGLFGSVELGGGVDELQNFRHDNRLTINQFTPKTQLSIIGNVNNVNKQGFSSSQFMSMMSAMGGFGRGGGGNFNFGGGLSDGFVNTNAGGVNFNYDITKKAELNLSYFLNNIENNIDQFSVRENFYPGQDNFFNIDTLSSLSTNTSHAIAGKLEIEIDSTQEMQLRFGFNANDPYSSLTEHRIIDTLSGISNDISNTYSSDNTDLVNSLTSRLLYNKRFGKRFFSVEGEYDSGRNNIAGQQESLDLIDGEGNFFHGYNSFDDQMSYSVDLSYVEPLGGGHYLEAGYIRSNSLNDYGLATDDLSFFSPQQIDSLSNTNHRDYLYNRYGLSYQFNSERTNFSFGLDVQQSLLNGTFSIPGVDGPDELIQKVSTPNTAILPSMNLRYEIAEKQNLSINYRTSIREPSLEQLQTRKDISDPLSVYVGNPELNVEYRHNIRVHYFKYNQFNFSSIFAYLGTTYVQDKIINKVELDENFVRTTSPINVDDDLTITGRFSYSTPIRRLHIKTRASLNGSYRNNTVFTNGIEDISERIMAGLDLSIENRKKEHFDARIGGRINYNNVKYEINDRGNLNYLNQRLYSNMELTTFEAWNFSTDFSVNFFSEESFGEAQTIPIWTTSVSRYFLKGNRGEVRLSVFDILNRNKGINRSNTLNYIESSEINSLGRYYMASFIYSLKGTSNEGMKGMRMRMHH